MASLACVSIVACDWERSNLGGEVRPLPFPLLLNFLPYRVGRSSFRVAKLDCRTLPDSVRVTPRLRHAFSTTLLEKW